MAPGQSASRLVSRVTEAAPRAGGEVVLEERGQIPSVHQVEGTQASLGQAGFGRRAARAVARADREPDVSGRREQLGDPAVQSRLGQVARPRP